MRYRLAQAGAKKQSHGGVFAVITRPSPILARGRGKKEFFMKKQISSALALLIMTLVLPLLSACHTTEGAGEDISATGHVIDRAAEKATP